MKLFVSTVTDKIYLVLFNEAGLVREVVYQGNNDHSQTFYQLYRDLKIAESELNQIYVVTGPGSFTGIRVGLIFTKLLAQKLNLKLIPLNYLKLLTTLTQKKVALDARGGNFYILADDEVLITTELSDELINPEICVEDLVSYLNKTKLIEKLPNEVEAEYVKNPIS